MPNLGHWQGIMASIDICDHISPTSVLSNVIKGGLIITVFGALKHIFSSQYVTPIARPDFAKLDVFLGQHIFLTLEQHFNPNILY